MGQLLHGIDKRPISSSSDPPVTLLSSARLCPPVFGLLDMDSVHILKGPQGTLYGRNATGGAIVVNTAAPTDEMEGYTLAEYGRFDHILGEGVINLPVSDTISVRFAGRYTQEDGYIHNLTSGRDEPDRKAHVIRGSTACRPISLLPAGPACSHSTSMPRSGIPFNHFHQNGLFQNDDTKL